MIAIHPLDDSLKAVGYTSRGEIKEFKINEYGLLSCYSEDLVRLDIPEGVKYLDCYSNLFTELKLTKNVECLNCCNNKIYELNLPNNIKELWCDKRVKGLENIDWDCDITLL